MSYRELMLNENTLWTAVVRRNSQWDGVFVYGVPSTRIYCRPTCPSRRPTRNGVRFFASGSLAEAAGFKACRRCRPNDPPSLSPQIDRVRRACSMILSRLDESLSLGELARDVGGNPRHLLRTFKQVLGITPREYVEACRVGCLKAELRNGRGVAAATFGAGYGSGSRVYEKAPAILGMTPATYAAGGRGEHVRYAIVDSPLGRLLIGATSRGVCAVKIGTSDRTLETVLRREYPAASSVDSDPQLEGWARTIVESLEPGAPDPRLPMDIRATAFQRRVWRELQRIPRGSTRSYGEVARRLGRPGAARAVARACASNPVALLIPCHRVVRGDGAVGGYHWGVERKRALLEAERTR
jgi:AraC family transcriptional regulator of adaptative response/methylated-DNA-[protein]-cysteine methyltransferase